MTLLVKVLSQSTSPQISSSMQVLAIAIADSFLGDSEQIPPRVSAVKVAGKRAYQRQRAGEEFELKPRSINDL